MKRLRHWIGAWVVSCALAVHAAEPTTIRLDAGAHHLLARSQPVARLAIADPQVADVQLVSNREVLLYAKKMGATELRLWPKGGTVETYRVLVNAPSGAAQGIDSAVQTDIKVVEVSRRALMQSGMNFVKNVMDTTIAVSAPGALSGVKTNNSGGFTLESGSGFLPINQAFNLVAGSAEKGLLGIISLLEGNGFAYTLAEPSLTVMNGQTATFLAGGEIPIPIATGDDTVSIDYREYGVRLTLTPTVFDRQRIMLKVAPEVSEIDPTTGVETGGVAVPGLRVRKTETTVQLAEGESFVISGLISRSNVTAVDKVPYLGDIPLLGAFFKSTRIEREDKELIMVVTPHLVRAIERGAPTPPLPGVAHSRYRPGFAQMLFLETGRFDRLNSGSQN